MPGLPPYAGLSRCYDAGWGPWSGRYLELLGELLAQEGPPPARVLDLGCGTGLLAVGLAALGHRVVGLDASPEMIALARGRATAGTEFAVQDMAEAAWAHPFELVTCTFDAFNYLLTEARVERFLLAVVHLLVPRGLLVFDANTARLYAAHHRGTLARQVGAEAFQQVCSYQPDTGLASTAFLFADGTREEHLQRAWDLEGLRPLLEAAGLQVVAALADPAGEPYRDDSERLVCVARRAG